MIGFIALCTRDRKEGEKSYGVESEAETRSRVNE